MTNTYEIQVDGYGYTIIVLDGTHLKFKYSGTGQGAVLHFNQVSDLMMEVLKNENLVRGNYFKYNEV